MKKYLILLIALMFAGCATVQREEFTDLQAQVNAMQSILIEEKMDELITEAEKTAADQKLSALASTAPYEAVPAGSDLMYFVDVTGNTSHSITVAYLMSYLSTNTAVITGGTIAPVTDAAADFAAAFTGANLYGGTFICDTAGTIQLPAIAAGMNFTIITKGAIAVSADTNASDLMVLDGVALDDGDKATNASTAGDIIVFQYMNATGWVATSNGWTDGGA
jgi:hypothetical protein